MMRDAITIVSPHQDDAALSLGSFIVKRSSMRINIVNCYTKSEYSPFRQGMNRSEVMRQRNNEDKEFCSHKQGSRIHLINLDEEDGPIRLSTRDMDFLLTERDLNHIDMDHLSSLRQKMKAHLRGLLLLPLGVGNHIDHNLASLAGLSLITKNIAVAFYLDVPYWLRISLDEVMRRVHFVETLIQASLMPYVDALPGTWDKTLLSKIYSSQISKENIYPIVNAPFSGEVILAPVSSVSRNLLLKAVTWMDLNH